MQTLEQRYASAAFAHANVVKGTYANDRDKQKQYGAMAHKLPVLIRTAGLAQALAFVDARGKDPHHLLLEHLAVTLNSHDRATLVTASRTSDLLPYIHLTQRVLAALTWYKRFAQSVLDVEASADAGTEDGV